jgi:hypothetical protein
MARPPSPHVGQEHAFKRGRSIVFGGVDGVLREFRQVRRRMHGGLAIAVIHDQGRRLAHDHPDEHGEGRNESDGDRLLKWFYLVSRAGLELGARFLSL